MSEADDFRRRMMTDFKGRLLKAKEARPISRRRRTGRIATPRRRRIRKAKPVQHEHLEQVHLFQWLAAMTTQYPDLQFAFAIPNGGLRHPVVAKYLKAEGVKAGVPDIFIPVPRSGYYGFFIEMKFGRNKPSDDQQFWAAHLQQFGFKYLVAYGWNAAADAIEEYIKT